MSRNQGVVTDQKILFAVGVDEIGIIMAFTKNVVIEERLSTEGNLAESIISEHGDEIQKLAPGLYVWEGDCSWDSGGYSGGVDHDPDSRLEGSIRPAHITDLVNFNFMKILPAPSYTALMEKDIVLQS